MYPEIDKNEKAQIEEVFGLTGGELADKPLRFATIDADYGYPRSYPPIFRIKRRWARYYYDGYPEYAEDLRNLERRHGGSYLTIVRDCTFDSAAPQTIYMHGQRWRRVARFRSSGEVECPMRTIHECMGHADHPTTLVDRRPIYPLGGVKQSEILNPVAYTDGHKVSIVTEEEAKAPHGVLNVEKVCPLCEAQIGQPHEYIYIGDGWMEIVYRRRD